MLLAPRVSAVLAAWAAILGGAGLGGAALFVAPAPATGRAAFWPPLRTLRDARAPVRVLLDRATVPRGASVTVTIEAPAAARAVLWTRGPGEAWRGAAVTLDSAGRAARRVGPLESDLYGKAARGPRTSAERREAWQQKGRVGEAGRSWGEQSI